MESIHPIGVVVRRTGLSAHVIRAWERRHAAVTPHRSAGNQRLYSEEDIQRLKLLSESVNGGASIGRIARQPLSVLRRFVQESRPATPPPEQAFESYGEDLTSRLEQAFRYIDQIDTEGLKKELALWLVNFGITPVIEQLVPQLMVETGERWSDGRYRIHQEHAVTQIVRSFLGGVLDEISSRFAGSTVVTATPPGEMHDIGTFLCAIAASTEGLKVIHLGADVPYPELIHFVHKQETAAILLSIIFASRNMRLVQGLSRLRSMVPPETSIILGGRAADWYGEQIQENGIEVISTINLLRKRLREIK